MQIIFNTMRFLALSLVAIFCTLLAYGQTDNVRGIITSLTGAPIPGVSVTLKGTSIGTVTDAKGQYTISVKQGQVIVFTSVGYEPAEVTYNGQASIDKTLQKAISNLEEVVVIGYGTSTKKELTSAITSLKPEQFNKGNFVDPVGLLQGKVAGLNIVRPNGGDVNEGFQIQLRGLATLSGGQQPLIIIDGVSGGDLNSVNVEEVESIDVLKDGSAAAIYGTRGTNGVIIITTKKGKPGQQSIDFSAYTSVQTVAKKLRVLSADEFRTTIEKIYPGRLGEFDHGANTDWFKEVTRTPIDHYTNLSMTGGTDKFSYRSSINYRSAQGIVINNSNKRLQGKMSITQKGLNNRLTIDYGATFTHSKENYTDQEVLQQAFRRNPTEPVYDATNTDAGGYYRNQGPFQYYNPVAMLNEEATVGKWMVITGSMKASYNIGGGFTASVFGSLLDDDYKYTQYQTKYYPQKIGVNGYAKIYTEKKNTRILEFSGDYSKHFGAHDIKAVGGYSYQDQGHEQFEGSNSDFDTDLYGVNNIRAGANLSLGAADMWSYKESNKLIAFFGRVMYNYNQKYMLQLSLRHEGSSRFGENHKWGNFPAASVAWRINKERFMQNVAWLSDLKLRAGYGVTGNQDIGNYRSLSLLSVGGRFYYNGSWVNTYEPASNPNPDLRWEKKQELNIGLDYGVLKNRISGSIDYYVRTTKDLLWTYTVPVPPNLYNSLYANVGSIQNKGIEVSINTIPVQRKNITWNSNFVLSRNRNKLISFSNTGMGFNLTDLKEGYLGVDIQTWTHQIVEGGALGNFVALKFMGIDANGLAIYEDKNKDGSITDADRQIVGNAYPKVQLSWSNSVTWKKFDASILFRSSIGNDVLNVHRLYYENFGYLGGKNILYSALDYPEYKGKAEYSSRFVEDASFVKLDNLSIGFNQTWNNGPFKKIRIYLTGQQLITITKYKGVDPEVNIAGLSPGIDSYNYYPRTRTFTLGINLGL